MNALRLELSKRELQLDELVAAVGSPVSAAAEDQHQPVWPHQLRQRPALALLIGQGEIRNLLANLGPGTIAVVLCLDELKPIVGCDVSTSGRNPADHVVQD